MSLRKCRISGCPERVRTGLVRPDWDKTVRGGEKADGMTCWRCRAGQRKHRQNPPKKRKAKR